MTQTILLVGATGMLGSRVAAHLSDQLDVRLRLLVRDAANGKLKPLLDRGAEVIEGGLSDVASLDRATQGVDVITARLPSLMNERQLSGSCEVSPNVCNWVIPVSG